MELGQGFDFRDRSNIDKRWVVLAKLLTKLKLQ